MQNWGCLLVFCTKLGAMIVNYLLDASSKLFWSEISFSSISKLFGKLSLCTMALPVMLLIIFQMFLIVFILFQFNIVSQDCFSYFFRKTFISLIILLFFGMSSFPNPFIKTLFYTKIFLKPAYSKDLTIFLILLQFFSLQMLDNEFLYIFYG